MKSPSYHRKKPRRLCGRIALPKIKIPFITPVSQDTDVAAQDSAVRQIFDGYLDVVGTEVSLFKRPGLANWNQPTSSSIDGLFDWDENNMLVFVSNATVYAYDSTDTLITLGSLPSSGVRVVFAQAKISGEQILCMCADGPIFRTDGTASSLTQITDVDAPSRATHLAFLDNYLIANNNIDGDRGRFFWSDVSAPTSWSSTSFQGADGKPDDIMSLAVGYRELIIVGRLTTEYFYNDGDTPFRRLEGSEAQVGSPARYSLTFAGGEWIFLTNKRKFVMMQNRVAKVISADIDQTLKAMTTVSDCRGDIMIVDGKEFLIFTFPTENRSFVFDSLLNVWYEWGNWNSATSTYRIFRGVSFAFSERRNAQFVGDVSNGRIYKLSPTQYSDYSGMPIRTMLETGFISHGTHNYKRSNSLQMRLKTGSGSTQGQVMFKYRDIDNEAYGNEIFLSSNFSTANGNFFCSLYQMGMYRARQYQIIHTDSTPFILSDIQEDVEMLLR